MSVVKAEQKESDFQVMVQYRKWEFMYVYRCRHLHFEYSLLAHRMVNYMLVAV